VWCIAKTQQGFMRVSRECGQKETCGAMFFCVGKTEGVFLREVAKRKEKKIFY